MNILIKFATRGRRDKFYQGLENIQSTISKANDYRILVSIDNDDQVMMGEISNLKKMPNVLLSLGQPVSKIEAINRHINYINFDWDLLINFSDDMRFTMKAWDLAMISSIEKVWGKSLDFFAHFNDGYVGDKLPTMSIMGREYYERFFYIYPPVYKSFSCDAESMFVAMMLGKHHYFPEILFRHEHYMNVGAKRDELYTRNEAHTKEDTDTFHRRLNKLFYVNNPETVPFQPFNG